MNLIIEIFKSALPASVPILLAALGGLFTWHANIFNISMEGMLLTSAFTSVIGSYLFGSWWMGLLFGIAGSVAVSLMFSFFVLKMKTGEFITGIAINSFATGATTYFLRQMFHVKGSLIDARIEALPKWDIPFIRDIPVLGSIINGHAFPLYVTFLIVVPAVYILIYKTSYGLRLRACGYDAKVIDSVGIKAERLKFSSIIICGVLCGVGGTFLSLGIMRMFTEGMSNGRGWISLAIIILSAGNPVKVFVTCLIFGITEGMGLTLQQVNIPNQITDMLPYAAVLAALYINSRQGRKKAKRVIVDHA